VFTHGRHAAFLSFSSVHVQVVDFAIPPAAVLIVLLILPLPLVMRKGIILFARNVLFFNVFGWGLPVVVEQRTSSHPSTCPQPAFLLVYVALFSGGLSWSTSCS
jgi:Zn-dependent membrane protease YugP